ncbi:NUDIX hydrolase [Streptodolium elevatio]|uniref:NUDIX hydrolase n=1 Tax=Streptodolium elevatio TaxID=3157996 RepID=A0ABV3DV69_9ACTN
MPKSPIEGLATDGRGNVLAAFFPGTEDAPPEDAPMPLSLVALRHDHRILLVFDRQRRSWELPGGMIEPAESPRQAALRELREETGQRADELAFAGYAKFVLGTERRTEYGALFVGRTTRPRPFQGNDEVQQVTWWDPGSASPGPTDSLDICLARLVVSHCWTGKAAGAPAHGPSDSTNPARP